MSLFKKIFGKNAADPAQSAHRSREPRILLQPLHRITFREKESGQHLGLGNLSGGGMGLLHQNDPRLRLDATIGGLLTIDKDEFEIEARVRHIGSVLAGCEFRNAHDPSDPERVRLRRSIENYFRVEILALNLRPVDPAYLKQDPRGATHWLTDGRQNEVYCVTDSEGVVAFHLSFLGHYVEGARGKATSGGAIVETSTEERPGHKGSALLDLSRHLDPETRALAKSFVQNVVRSPPDVRESLQKLLDQSG